MSLKQKNTYQTSRQRPPCQVSDWNRSTYLANLKIKTSLSGQCLENRCTSPSFMCSFNRGDTEGTNYWKLYFDVRVCIFLLCVWEVIGFVDWLDKRFMYEKRFDMYICLWPEFDCPEVTHCGWQDNKIQLLTHLQSLKVKPSRSGRCLWNRDAHTYQVSK